MGPNGTSKSVVDSATKSISGHVTHQSIISLLITLKTRALSTMQTKATEDVQHQSQGFKRTLMPFANHPSTAPWNLTVNAFKRWDCPLAVCFEFRRENSSSTLAPCRAACRMWLGLTKAWTHSGMDQPHLVFRRGTLSHQWCHQQPLEHLLGLLVARWGQREAVEESKGHCFYGLQYQTWFTGTLLVRSKTVTITGGRRGEPRGDCVVL